METPGQAVARAGGQGILSFAQNDRIAGDDGIAMGDIRVER